MRFQILAAFAAFALLAASPAEAFRVRPLPVRLGTLDEYPNSLTSIASLSNGNFVLAAGPWVGDAVTRARATAQVFRPGGQPLGEEIHCGESPTTFGIYRPTVVPDRDGFVFACQSYHRGSNKLFTTEYRRYDARGIPVGDTVLLDDTLITDLLAVTAGRDGTVLLMLEEHDGLDFVETTSRTFDRFDRPTSLQRGLDDSNYGLLPTTDGFLLAFSRAVSQQRPMPRVRIQRLTGDGTPSGPIRKTRLTDRSQTTFIRGPGGRAALSQIGQNQYDVNVDARVVLLDADGVPGRTLFIPIPHVYGKVEYSRAALPLDDGFVLLWSSYDRVETEAGYVTYNASYAQRYSNTGRPVGKMLEIGRNSSVSPLLTFEEASNSYLLSGVEYDDPQGNDRTRRFWRLNLGSTWGERR